jgi:hypothetical protein
MSRLSEPRPIPVGRLVPDRQPSSAPQPEPPERRSARWVAPAMVAIALSPFVLTAIGLSVATATRPEPRPAPRQVVYVPVAAPQPPAPAPAPEPSEVEPGEARRPPTGYRVSVEESPKPAAKTEPISVASIKGPKCDRFGTAIDFFRSPALACDRAARDQKLVMILHLAGYFDDPGFT